MRHWKDMRLNVLRLTKSLNYFSNFHLKIGTPSHNKFTENWFLPWGFSLMLLLPQSRQWFIFTRERFVVWTEIRPAACYSHTVRTVCVHMCWFQVSLEETAKPKWPPNTYRCAKLSNFFCWQINRVNDKKLTEERSQKEEVDKEKKHRIDFVEWLLSRHFVTVLPLYTTLNMCVPWSSGGTAPLSYQTLSLPTRHYKVF